MTAPWSAGLIRETLAVGVPLERLRLAAMADDQLAYAIEQARTEEGRWQMDAAMYGGARAAEGMASMIRTLAALSLADGGVTFDGLHWCPDHAHCLEVAGGAA